jgi:hypothetical protein
MSTDGKEQRARGRVLKPIGRDNPRWKLHGPEITVDFVNIQQHVQPRRIFNRFQI